MPGNLIVQKTLLTRKGLLLVIGLFFILLLENSASAAEPESPSINSSDLVQKAASLRLHERPEWLKLMHYARYPISKSGYKSAVHSNEFFLSQKGRFRPEEELITNIQAAAASVARLSAKSFTGDTNQEIACRFPARLRWLQKALNWDFDSNIFLKCSRYQQFIFRGGIKSISVIFATGFLGNPASYFGHPLIKFNLGSDTGNLLDVSLNFGALTPDQENPFLYVSKGLLGGYDAAFSHIQFFFHHHNYAETELRDLWEYELDMNKEEVHLIVDHAYEMLGMKITYYFLWDNCASRMAELLEFVFDTPLLPAYAPYAIPNTLFDRLAHGKRSDGRPFVRRIEHVPSRETRMSEMYLALKPEHRKLVKKIIADKKQLTSEEYLALNESEKSDVLEMLLEYYGFRTVQDKSDTEIAERKRSIVQERLKLPARTTNSIPTSSDLIPPHQAQRAFLTRVSGVLGERGRAFTELTIRPALYDYMSPEAARPKNSALSVAETVVRLEEDKAELRKLELFSVGTLNASRVDLPGTSSFAWKAEVGLKSRDLSCESCLIAGADVGVGHAWSLTKKLSAYILLTGQAQTDEDNYGNLALAPIAGGFAEVNSNWKMHLSAGRQKFFDGLRSEHTLIEIENRFARSRTWDVRLSYQENVGRFTKLSFSYYW